jgi:hypothetical protein
MKENMLMKPIFSLMALVAVVGTGAFAFRSVTAETVADQAVTAACKCGEDCKCDPCECKKEGTIAVAAACKCGEDCKCDPCECKKDGTVAVAATCKCGEDCKCDPCECKKEGTVAVAACCADGACSSEKCCSENCTERTCSDGKCGRGGDCTECKSGEAAKTADTAI